MKIQSQVYRDAFNRYKIAQAECPHWDYESPEGGVYACCEEMAKANDVLKRIRKGI